jgi:Leucine-rich repeat (LRR) protein
MSSPHVDGVLDLTFMDIRDETDLERCFNDKLSELNNAISSPKNSLDMKNTSKISPEDFKAVRLSYNNIASLDVVIALTRFLDPQKIYWFDLSYNNISTISDNFINAFPNIKTLYLQANKIKRLSEIKKLSRLTKLRSLCLFGNPIEEYKV